MSVGTGVAVGAGVWVAGVLVGFGVAVAFGLSDSLVVSGVAEEDSLDSDSDDSVTVCSDSSITVVFWLVVSSVDDVISTVVSFELSDVVC